MAIVNGTNNNDWLDAVNGVTAGVDTINGLGGNDTIYGLGGADDINGGSGIDSARYTDSNAAVQVSLLTGEGTGGTAQGDELESIENLTGSVHNDLLVGDDNDNELDGGQGGADTLKGGGGDDELVGVQGDDTLKGGGGDDTFRGGGGADDIDGGSGIDTATYSESNAAVQVSLLTGDGTGGTAQGDELREHRKSRGDLQWRPSGRR